MSGKLYRSLLLLAAMLAVSEWIAAPSRAQSALKKIAATESAPIPANQIPKEINAAINAPDRPAADKELDPGRQPDQIMAFYGIKPGMQVADIFAGGGYMTELIARVVGPTGKVYSQNGPFPEKYKKIEEAWHERLKEPALKNVVAVAKPFDAEDLLPVPAGTLDAVIIHLNYHDMVGFKINRDKVNAAVSKALKPGGLYAIVDHSGKAGSGETEASTLHRIDEQFLIKEVEKAGFKLVGASGALRHHEDDRTWNVFQHRGQTDRFMLKFVKEETVASRGRGQPLHPSQDFVTITFEQAVRPHLPDGKSETREGFRKKTAPGLVPIPSANNQPAERISRALPRSSAI